MAEQLEESLASIKEVNESEIEPDDEDEGFVSGNKESNSENLPAQKPHVHFEGICGARIEFTSTVEEEELRVQSIKHKIDLALAKNDLESSVKKPEDAAAVLDQARAKATKDEGVDNTDEIEDKEDVVDETEEEDMKEVKVNSVSEFDAEAERGRLLTKASLINRLEHELGAVEQQLAAIDQLRQAHPLNRSVGSYQRYAVLQNNRPSTAGPRSRSTSHKKLSAAFEGGGRRPMSAGPGRGHRGRPMSAARVRNVGDETTQHQREDDRMMGISGDEDVGVYEDINADIQDDSNDDDIDDPFEDVGRYKNLRPESRSKSRRSYSARQQRRPGTAGRGRREPATEVSRARPRTAGRAREDPQTVDNDKFRRHQRPSSSPQAKSAGFEAKERGKRNQKSRSQNNVGVKARPRTAGSATNAVRQLNRSSQRRVRGRARPASSPLVRASERKKEIRVQVGAIAGYEPPDLVYDQQMLARARQLEGDDIKVMIQTEGMKTACLSTGFRPKALLPRPIESFSRIRSGFQTIALSDEETHRRWNEHEERRVKWVAAVLSKRAELVAEATQGGTTPEGGRTKSTRQRPASAPARKSGGTIQEAISDAMQTESQRQAKVAKMRNKQRNVLLKENAAIDKRREDFRMRQIKKQRRESRVAKASEDRRRYAAVAAKKKTDEMARVKKEREAADLERYGRGAEQARLQEERRKALSLEKKMKALQKKKLTRDRQIHRQKVKEGMESALEKRNAAMRLKMAKKLGHVQQILKRKQAMLLQKKKETLLRQQQRKENSKRVRRQQEFRRVQLAKQLEVRYAKGEKMRLLRNAVVDDRRRKRKEALIARHKMLSSTPSQRNMSPGPGAYSLPSTLSNRGARISEANPKSYIEWEEYRSKQIPGPSQYGEADMKRNNSAAKFSTADVPSEIDWCIRRAKQMPAPDAYQGKIANSFQSDTSAFSMGNCSPKSDVDWIMLRSAEIPGPADYYKGLPNPTVRLDKFAKSMGVDPKKGARRTGGK